MSQTTTTPAAVDPAVIRQVVQAQTTVAAGLAALLQAVLKASEAALATPPHAGTLQALHDAMTAEPKEWVDSVLANTPDAMLSAGLTSVPGYLREMFATPPARAAHR